MTIASPAASGSVRSLERAIQLLNTLGMSGVPMGVTELGRATQLHKATVLRLLSELERHDFVQKVRGRYQIGLAVVPLSNTFLMGNSLTRAALPVLEELSTASQKTVTLFARLGFHRVVVQRIEGPRPLRYAIPVGQRLPLHLGAGKVLAAAMPEEELQQLLDGLGEVRLTTGELKSKEALRAEIERCRLQGFTVSFGERNVGTATVAAPVISPDGVVLASLALTWEADSLSQAESEPLSREVRRAAQAIGERYLCV